MVSSQFQKKVPELVKAIQYAIDNNKDSVTLVHKGNIMKFTEGAFKNWGYDVAKKEFGGKEIDGGPWQEVKILIMAIKLLLKMLF